MPQFDERHVKLCGGFIVWDGVTSPEIMQQGAKAGQPKWSLKVVFEPNNPDLALFDQLINKALMESKWRGTLPGGGRLPINTCGPNEYNGLYNGWAVISFKTTLKQPDVYDENGKPVDAMALSQVVYTGQKVDVLAHCYEYDNAGNRGISGGLDAFAVIMSAQAQRQSFGSGGVDTASAFGGGTQQPPQPAYGQQPDPHQAAPAHVPSAARYSQAPAPGAGNATYPSNQQAQNYLPPRQ